MRKALAGSIAVALAMASFTQAAIVTLQQGVAGYAGHLDVMVRNDSVANENVSSNTAVNATGKVTTGVLRNLNTWDLSDIPAGATITSVSLTLQHRSDSGASTPDDGNQVDDANDPLFELRTISAPIVEPPVTTTATGSGSDWDNTFDAGMTLGGSALSSANADPNIGSQLLNVIFASSPNFVAAAQAAADSPSNQLNFAVKVADETLGNRSIVQWGSNFGNIAGVGTVGNADRPILTIEYVIPEPASLGVLTGCVALLGRKRRA